MGTYFVGSNVTFNVFAYEGFSYTISNPDPGSYTLQVVSNSGGFGPSPSPVYFTKNGNNSYTFGVSDLSNNLTPGTTETFVLQATGPSTLVSSNLVTIGAGRFLDGSGNNLSNTSYTFYKNEPITPVRFVAPSFKLKQPLLAIPALPPGLSFVSNASNIYDLTGTPLVTVPTSNYQIIGVQDGGSKIVTTRINLTISNERLRVDLSGSPIVNNMTIGTTIGSRVFTVRPPSGTTGIRYTYASFPDGIVVRDINGITQTGTSFAPSDPSFTMIITGAPTSNAAYAFRNAGVTATGVTYPIQVSRTSPLPIIESSQALTFSFGETVLFDLSSAPVLYNGIPVDPSAVFFRAGTYFGSSVGMSNIVSPDLRSDLSLTFVPSLSRANLTGTPTSAGSGTYTLRATNSNGTTRDYSVPITVSNDSVTFASPVGVDLCYNFILSRPVDQAKTGYYPSNIQFLASAASKLPVTLSAPALAGTGLSLDSNGVITGIPTAVTSQTDLIVTANVSGSPATGTKTVKFAVLNDVFTFANVSSSFFNFIQNVPATPFQIQATTLSERGIIGFAQTGFPDGLTISPAGIVSGTPRTSSPASGNVTIAATTGYASGTRDFSYNIIPDTMIFTVPQPSYTAQAGQPIGPVNVDGVTYSGTTVSNYDLSISPTYGMTINASNGILGGTWISGLPPGPLLPSSCNFTVKAQAGNLQGDLLANITATPVVRNTMFFTPYRPTGGGTFWIYYTSPELMKTPSVVNLDLPSNFTGFAIADVKVKNNDPLNNVILMAGKTAGADGGFLVRGTRIDNLSRVPVFSSLTDVVFSEITNKVGTSTWWAGGRLQGPASMSPFVLRSDDDGLTWDVSGVVQIRNTIETRDRNGSNIPVDARSWPYLIGGLALAYDTTSGVMLAGGNGVGTRPSMVISTDEGLSWALVGTGLLKETAKFNLDNSSVWIAVGSDDYQSVDKGSTLAYTTQTCTIRYSTDQGSSWTRASNDFNMFGYDIAYANNTWIAIGVNGTPETGFGAEDQTYTEQLRYSTDGSNWTAFDLSTNTLVPTTLADPILAPLRTGPIAHDSNYWYIFVNEGSNGTGLPKVYTHDLSTSLASNWTAIPLYGGTGWKDTQSPPFTDDIRYTTFSSPAPLFTGEPPTNVTLSFTTSPGAGPTFTSPSSLSFLQYQHVPISPIQLAATGTGTIYFFVTADDLPPGLTFNPRTNIISGAVAQAGTLTTNVYAKDDTGIRILSLTFTTLIPRIVRQQDGAGSYTSLLRQYTEVLGAQNARDSRVYPTQESKLGEFMSPEAPDVITQTVDPSCFGPSNCL